jgi:cytochrome c556
MKHTVGLGLMLAACLLALPAAGQGDKVPEIKEIMKKLNSPTGIYSGLGKELKADDTDWGEVKAGAKTIARLAALVGKNDPPKGEKDSWTKLTKEYADNAKAFQQAAAKEDKKAALAAYEKIAGTKGANCTACHNAHRPK